MSSICLYFQVHQPYRIRQYSFFNIGIESNYFDEELNITILNKVADKCYIPANKLMLELIQKSNKKFRIAFSISGVAIEQFEKYRPDVLDSFIRLAKTGCVEFLSETYYHSLSYVYSKPEFERQIELHREKIVEHFNQVPKVFRNTECIFDNQLAEDIYQLGFKGILAEGVPYLLQDRSPNQLYTNAIHSKIKVLLRNFILSDDIAFRFSNSSWSEYPLTANKYTQWLNVQRHSADCINLFMDYETIGEHQSKASGIFDFIEHFAKQICSKKGFQFHTPSEICEKYDIEGIYDANYTTSWADTERDLSAWIQNTMQQESLNKLYSFREDILSLKSKELLNQWSMLQSSDHFYYMSTKHWADGAVHQYFSPYSSPYDAYIYFINALSDLEIRIAREKANKGIH
ncbi:MAG: alpha-amylase [Cytophagales bacterium]|nr:MAG: alpha-amylase [Cytophagales bacterium]